MKNVGWINKRIALLAVITALCFTAACGRKAEEVPQPATDAATEQSAPSPEQPAPEQPTPEQPAPEPAKIEQPAPEPEPEPEPEPQMYDCFDKTETKGVYHSILMDEKLPESEVFMLGDKLVVSFIRFGDGDDEIDADEYYEAIYDPWQDDYDEENIIKVVRTIDLKTGESYEVPVGRGGLYNFKYYGVNDECFCICDSEEGILDFYDADLNVIKSVVLPEDAESEVWIAEDMSKVLFIDDLEGVLYAYDLDTDTIREICANGEFENASVRCFYGSRRYFGITHYDRDWNMSEHIIDGLLEREVGIGHDFSDYYINEDDGEMFLCNYEDSLKGVLYKVKEDAPCSRDDVIREFVGTSKGEFDVFYVDYINRCVITKQVNYPNRKTIIELNCYNLDNGELIKSYARTYTDDFSYPYIVSDYGRGSLYIVCSDESLDVTVWNYLAAEDVDPEKFYIKRNLIPAELDARRCELEDKYGIYIYLGSEIFASDFDYKLTRCDSEREITETLDTLDEVLAMYPPSLLHKLREWSYKTLGVYICGGFTKIYDYSADNTIALATSFDYERALALDAYQISGQKNNIAHEVSHWIDNAVSEHMTGEQEEQYREAWDALNPKGFEYLNSYVSYNYKYSYIFYTDQPQKAYFVDGYSQTYVGEDRSRLFEYTMFPPEDYDYLESEHIRDKARLYFLTIREILGDETWPEETAWEKRLAEADKKYK